MLRKGSITIEYKDIIIERYHERPEENLVTPVTIARDLKRLKLDLKEFEHQLKIIHASSLIAGKNSDIQVVSEKEAREKERQRKRLEVLHQKNIATQVKRNKQVDHRVRRKLRTMTDMSKKILYAAKEVHTKSVADLIDNGADVNYQDPNGYTPLMEAAKYSRYSSGSQDPLKVIQLLITNGAEINARNRHKETALTMAIKNGWVDIAELLIQYGAPIKGEARTVFHLVENDKTEMLHYVARSGVSLDSRLSGLTPLLWSLRGNKHPEMATLLLELGADPCVADDYQQTALMWSLDHPDINTFKNILSRCGEEEIAARSKSKSTVLHRAAVVAKHQHAALLINAGADTRAKDKYGRTPLHETARNRYETRVPGSIATAKLLLEAGADINAVDSGGNTALILAGEYGIPEYIGYLVSQGADLLPVNDVQRSAAHVMASRGHTAALEKILDFSVEFSDEKPLLKDETPLIAEAIARNNPETAMALIDCGAGLEIRRRGGGTPLVVAAGKPEAHFVVKRLIELDANLNAQDNAKRTALMHSIFRQSDNATFLLLDAGADIELLDNKGQTAMHWAAISGTPEVILRLIVMNADLDHQDIYGETPLMVADTLEIARLLVKAGANTEIRDKAGRTALDHAKQMHKIEVAEFLEE